MQTAVWGPPGWSFLHSVAHGFPESPAEFDAENDLPIGTTAARHEQFFLLVGSILPCKYCRDSYMRYVAESPPRVDSRLTLTRWLWEVHNKVNEKLGATYKSASYKDVFAKYESFRAKCSDSAGLGCTTPDLHHTKKRARVVVERVSCTDRTTSVVFSTLVVALALTAVYNMYIKQRAL